MHSKTRLMLANDVIWIVLGFCILVGSFGYSYSNNDFVTFQRFGALMVLVGAKLTLDVQRRTLFHSLYIANGHLKMIGLAMHAISRVDADLKHVMRQLTSVTEAAGVENPWGPMDQIKAMELTPAIKAMQDIEIDNPTWSRYHRRVETFGTCFIWGGTAVWGFGDLVPNLLPVGHQLIEYISDFLKVG